MNAAPVRCITPVAAAVAAVAETVDRLRTLENDLARVRRVLSAYRQILEGMPCHIAVEVRAVARDLALPQRAHMLAHLRLTLDDDALERAGYSRAQIEACAHWLHGFEKTTSDR